MAKLSQAQEPSMEEILASIRRIITEDDSEPAVQAPPPPPPAPSLSTEAIDALFAVRPSEPQLVAPRAESRAAVTPPSAAAPRPSVAAATVPSRSAAPARVDAPPARPEARAAVAPTATSVRHDDGGAGRPLLSPGADAAVHAAFGNLAGAAPSAPGSARTLEDIAKELLRPMLKAWLDSNLPPLVERLVRDEIERVSRGR